MRFLLMLAFSVPAFCQFTSIEVRFEGVGCASCVDSLPSRVQRIRGVESATVDSKASILRVKLAGANRVRFEQIRDMVEQDGTKAKQIKVVVRGELKNEAGKWVLYPSPAAGYPVSGTSLAAGVVEIEGVIDSPGATINISALRSSQN